MLFHMPANWHREATMLPSIVAAALIIACAVHLFRRRYTTVRRIVVAVADAASQLVHRCDGDRTVFLETSIRTARRLPAASMLSTYCLYFQRPLSRRRHTVPQTSRPVIDRLGIVTVQMCQI